MRQLARGLVVTASLSLAFACSQGPGAQPGAADTAQADDGSNQSAVDRGKLLVTIGGCNDCHTPKTLGPNGPEPDMTRMLSGHPEDQPITQAYTNDARSPWAYATNDQLTAWSGPWGVSFAANLTPDTLTGLRSGVWTEDLFINAMRTGKHMATSRPILPPMPWQALAQLSDDDLRAIWAYLGTIPPIENHVPDPITPDTLARAMPN